MKQIILASTSPRRREILNKTGLKFKVIDSGYEENMGLKLDPINLAKKLSLGKAEAVAIKYPDHLIIAADTFVAMNDILLGKPQNSKIAVKMLNQISGRWVSIITGYTVLDSKTKQKITKANEAKVKIKKLTNSEIKNYIRTKEPLDKAGAFAIQGIGAVLIEKIDGDFFSIMGLPLFDLAQTLKKFKVKIL